MKSLLVNQQELFGERFKEHLKAPFQIYDHSSMTSHIAPVDNFNIVGRED